MSLVLKNRGTNSSLFTLGEGCFDKVNTEAAGPRAPYGVLGGTVAALDPNNPYTVVQGNGENNTAVGLFLNNAEGSPFENSPAVGSGKVAVCQKQASVEVDIYEAFDYKPGQYLYCSGNGYLTGVKSGNGQIIGVVTKVPTAADPFLGLDMYI